MSNDHRRGGHVDVVPLVAAEQLVERKRFSLAFLGEIQRGKVERIRLNSSQPIGYYNNECPFISGFVTSGVRSRNIKL
jgi:hypothetical protein